MLSKLIVEILLMSDYYFHSETKKIYMLLDDDVCLLWDDYKKDKDLLAFDIKQFYAIFDVLEKHTFMIECDDFTEEFVPIDEENFDEIHDDFGFDELTKQRIKNEMFKQKY